MLVKTLDELNAEERAYLLGKTNIVPTTGKKVETLRKEFQETVDTDNARREKLFAKQRASQAERDAEFAKSNDLANPNGHTTMVANKVIQVRVASDTENTLETAVNSDTGNHTADTEPVDLPELEELPSKSALLATPKAELIKLANKRNVEIVHDVDTIPTIVDKLLA